MSTFWERYKHLHEHILGKVSNTCTRTYCGTLATPARAHIVDSTQIYQASQTIVKTLPHLRQLENNTVHFVKPFTQYQVSYHIPILIFGCSLERSGAGEYECLAERAHRCRRQQVQRRAVHARVFGQLPKTATLRHKHRSVKKAIRNGTLKYCSTSCYRYYMSFNSCK